jgi:hypothetical protein
MRTAVIGELKMTWKSVVVAYVEKGLLSQDLSGRTEMERLKPSTKNICSHV